MDGSDLNVGSVADLREVEEAIKVAKHVMLYTKHSMLAGNQATEFAVNMGFKKESLFGDNSKQIHKSWLESNCSTNFWINVTPDPTRSCGPYKPTEILESSTDTGTDSDSENHDTIGMIVIDDKGNIFCGTSTNGINYKIPGRVGDSPIPGAGTYCNNQYGAAAVTGKGDVSLRHLPSFLAVELLRNGFTPKEAADTVISRINEHYPTTFIAIIVTDKDGNYAAACNYGGLVSVFPFYVTDERGRRLENVTCFKSSSWFLNP